MQGKGQTCKIALGPGGGPAPRQREKYTWQTCFKSFGVIMRAMKIARPMPAALIALGLASSLAGCAGDLPAITAPQPAPANYRQMTKTYFANTLAKLSTDGASISAIQPTVAPQPAEWFACVKLASGQYYTVFYTGGAVVDARSALGIDRCGVAEGYAPFPLTAPPAKPSKAKKGAKG
jgi:hypothetical protein